MALQPGAPLATVQLEDDDLLIRKAPDLHIQTASNGLRRVSAAVFSASSTKRDPLQGMSVDLFRILLELGIDPRDAMQFAPEFKVIVGVTIGHLKSLGLNCVHSPVDGNRAHCNVFGVTTRIRERIMAGAQWVRRPIGFVELGER
jgi:hypothetical protein